MIVPILGLLTAWLVKFLKEKMDLLAKDTKSDILAKYIEMARDTVTECVIATNQTYVDALKEAGKFDAESQKEAFNKTLTSVLAILGSEAKEYLTEGVGDLNVYITNLIESTIKNLK